MGISILFYLSRSSIYPDILALLSMVSSISRCTLSQASNSSYNYNIVSSLSIHINFIRYHSIGKLMLSWYHAASITTTCIYRSTLCPPRSVIFPSPNLVIFHYIDLLWSSAALVEHSGIVVSLPPYDHQRGLGILARRSSPLTSYDPLSPWRIHEIFTHTLPWPLFYLLQPCLLPSESPQLDPDSYWTHLDPHVVTQVPPSTDWFQFGIS